MNENTNIVRVTLQGRIDSANAAEAEEAILQKCKDASSVILDAEHLEYISSAGLRILLRIRKRCPDIQIVNVSSEIYDILEMTGFTEMMTVKKAYQVVSIEGCEEIGKGAKGTLYRIDQDNVVKVYNEANALDDIIHERKMARLALVLGIPTAISYDVVKVKDSYGSVFELLNAKSFASIMINEPEKMDWCVKEYTDMLKKIHSTVVPTDELPNMKETVLQFAEFIKPHLPEEAGNKLIQLIQNVPEDNHMIHGDYHTKNIVLMQDEVLIIDMDTLSYGNPIFELGFMFNAFRGFTERDPKVIEEFQGFSAETGKKFWHKVLSAYLETKNETKIQEVENKAKIIGYTRLLRHFIQHSESQEDIDFRKERLIQLLQEVDTLCFDKNTLEVDALNENLPVVQAFLEEKLEDVSVKIMMQISLAVEEIFVNIALYAYVSGQGKATMQIIRSDHDVTIVFKDRGIPYNPTLKEDPDLTQSAEQRDIGGLGIFLTKKNMDEVEYAYEDGQNVLTMKKKL